MAGPALWAGYASLQLLNTDLGFEPLSVDDSARLEASARTETADTVLDRKVCVVTDAWVYLRDATRVPLESLPLDAMKATLGTKPWVTGAILEYYDCSPIDARLGGLLLSRRAFEEDGQGNISVWFGTGTLEYLRAIQSFVLRNADTCTSFKPPRFAIADGFVAGSFPDIDNMTVIERQAVGLVQMRGVVKVVYGGPGKMLQSHLLSWDNRNATIASRVPSVVTKEAFQIVLAGPMTTPQELLLSQKHECSGERVWRGYELLRSINVLYADVDVNATFDADCRRNTDILVRLDESDDTSQLIANARARQVSVGRMYEDDITPEERECTLIESETCLLDTQTDHTERERLERAFANVTGRDNTFVARRSEVLLTSADPSYLERLFPHLLTFGIGGFSMTRCHKYSHRSIALHYLNLSTHRFAQDPMFKLAVFDHLSTARVKSNVFLRVGRDPTLSRTLMSITPQELRVAMQNRENQRKAWKEGRVFVPSTESAAASRALQSIKASAAKMWGSNDERESLTRKVDSMTIFFGAPSVFWTLTPNPDCSLLCAFWSGYPLPSGRPDSYTDCHEINMPASAEMSRIVMGNAFLQATYYKVCANILIGVLFGWDMAASKPKATRGIFGFVEALVYALEQQGRLFVHHHGVAWVAGLPKTKSDWNRLLASDELKARYEQYCASIFSAELPLYDTIDDLVCPRACGSPLAPIPIHAKYKHVLKHTVRPPVVASCTTCGVQYTEDELVTGLLDGQWNALDEEHKVASSSAAVEAIRHKFCGVSPHPATANVQLSRLLRKDQVHAYTHTRSCVKGQTGTKCRYNFFRELADATKFNDSNEMQYRRRPGNQYLNPLIALWCRVFHFNMDSRLLWSGHGLQATRYALQYAIKQQTVADNIAVVNLSFNKRVSREPSLSSTDYGLGIGRLLSLSYAQSGVMEIGGPLASAIIVEDDAVIFGCHFQRLVLVEGLNTLSNLPVEASVVVRDHRLYTETSMGKYMARPNCLEHLSWYEFCAWYTTHATRMAPSTTPCSFCSTDPAQLGPHVKTHGYTLHNFPRVPEIIGPRMPDSTRLGFDDYAEKTELYCRMVLLLYCPFRDATSFLSVDRSAATAFETWDPLAHASVARALEHHQHYYDCLEAAEQYRFRRSRSQNNQEEEQVLDDPDILSTQETPIPRTSDFVLIPSEMYPTGDEPLVDESWVMDDTSAPEHFETPTERILAGYLENAALPVDETQQQLVVCATPITRADITTFQTQVVNAASTTPDVSFSIRDANPEVVVQVYADAIRDLHHSPPSDTATSLRQGASIKEISAYFSLNAKQHAAFVLIAVPLLAAIAGESSPRAFKGKTLIVTGAGGTGKSQIVRAVRELCTCWGSPRALSVVASTGIAAASLGGSTMHSSVGLHPNCKQLPKHIESPTDELLQRWAPVRCVIADELPMIGLSFFSLWERSLRKVKESTEPFGGLITVLMFDHCQLHAIKGMPMYTTSEPDKAVFPLQSHGYCVYRAFTQVVYLTDNMRFLNDPEWGYWLSRARLGDWCDELRSFIANVPDYDLTITTTPTPRGLLQTISSDNVTRAEVNDSATRLAVRCLRQNRRVFVIPARLSRKATPAQLSAVRSLPDNKTGNIPVYLHAYIGMPVRIRANQCISKGVANGATGCIHHIDWHPDTVFSPQGNGTWLASREPLNLFVNITNCRSQSRFPSLPPTWPPSVMPVYQVSASFKLNSTHLSTKGFPVVPAFGTTVHGVQGETREAIALTNLRPPSCTNTDRHALYVALSRLKSRDGLYLLGDRPSPADYVHFSPQHDVLAEDLRLRQLSSETLSHFGRLLTDTSDTSTPLD